uniref:Uncharacterized protein n=1 Tax=Ascaris lumbricoides TaxID=6252 RepID=A0A0M3IDV1_ASCLU
MYTEFSERVIRYKRKMMIFVVRNRLTCYFCTSRFDTSAV